MTRLLLLRHGTTAETRRAAFPATSGARSEPACAPLDRSGEAQAAALARLLPPTDRCWSSLAARARQTALAVHGAPEAVPDLAECDFGAWAGRTLEEAHALDPDGLSAWWADPDAAPHGGERLADVRARAVRVLARAAGLGGVTLAVTHGGLIKSALLEVLGLPATAVWRLDADPGSLTGLHHVHGRWRLARLNWTPTLPGTPRAGTAQAGLAGGAATVAPARPDAQWLDSVPVDLAGATPTGAGVAPGSLGRRRAASARGGEPG